MFCHGPHASGAYAVAVWGMGFVFPGIPLPRLRGGRPSTRQGHFGLHGRWPSPGLSRLPRTAIRGKRERSIRASGPFRRSPVPPHPACRSSIAFRSIPFPSSFRRPAGRRDPNSRVSCARLCRRGRALAPARFARLIARMRLRARAKRRAHFARWPTRGLFRAGAKRKTKRPRGCRSLLSGLNLRCVPSMSSYF